MKEERRAAQQSLAHKRCVAALKELDGDSEKVQELEDLGNQRLPVLVRDLYETQIMAQILEDLAGISSASSQDRFVVAAPSINKDSATDPSEEGDIRNTPVDASGASVSPIESSPAEPNEAPSPASDSPAELESLDQDVIEALEGAGYDSAESIRAASDEDLLDINGIGPAKLREIREKVG